MSISNNIKTAKKKGKAKLIKILVEKLSMLNKLYDEQLDLLESQYNDIHGDPISSAEEISKEKSKYEIAHEKWSQVWNRLYRLCEFNTSKSLSEIIRQLIGITNNSK